MEISAEWAGVALGLIAAVSGGIGYFLRDLKDRRAMQPIALLRPERIEIINRCSEPLHVDRLDAPCAVCTGNREQDEYGEETRPIYEPTPVFPGWEIAPHSTGTFPLWVDGPSDTSIEILVTSSLRTIRSKRVTVRPSQIP